MASSDRPNRNLVTLGSAAVIAIYAAGYIRTKPAAARIAEESEARTRRPPVQAKSAAPPTVNLPVKPLADSATRVAAMRRKKTDAEKRIEDPESAKAESAAVASLREEAERPTKMVVPPLNYTPPAEVKAAPTAADSLKPGSPPWSDGLFYGWGTSRHGDIKVGIEIRGGAIARAFISECLTRYSCSWVAHLPRQVVDRQSPETDFVTSATESANAFYYGVVNALKQAK